MNTQPNPLSEGAIVRRLSLVSIVGNTVLSVFKAYAGIIGHSGAMVSDAVHSFSDVLTTIIAVIGVRFSQKEADAAHPYGHERIECVAALFLGLLLMLTGLGVGKAGVEAILSGGGAQPVVPGVIALAAAVVSILTKEAMYWYTRHYARVINSTAFLADAWHHRSDALSSVGSLIGIGGAMLGYPVLDAVASVIICCFIFKVAVDILRDAVSKMMDTSCDEAYESELRAFVEHQPDVVCVDLLHTRQFGSKVYMDLEIQVDGDKPLRESHAVAERVHDSVEAQFPAIKHIMVHVNPAE